MITILTGILAFNIGVMLGLILIEFNYKKCRELYLDKEEQEEYDRLVNKMISRKGEM